MAMVACYPTCEVTSPLHQQARIASVAVAEAQKDYSIPLHVDCSVEYELPNQAKPPAGARMEPLLMIHPCYFRKIESQRRSPFVNNMPPARGATVISSTAIRRASRATQSQQQRQQQQQQQHMEQQNVRHVQQQSQSASHTHAYTTWDNTHILPMPALVSAATAATAAISMYSKPVGKRDAMLSGGCGAYGAGSGGHWEAERSTVPRDYQAGPDAAPVTPVPIRVREEKQHILTGKYRQYLRAHRLHPYMMSGTGPGATAMSGATFHPMGATPIPQMQQVSCYNV